MPYKYDHVTTTQQENLDLYSMSFYPFNNFDETHEKVETQWRGRSLRRIKPSWMCEARRGAVDDLHTISSIYG